MIYIDCVKAITDSERSLYEMYVSRICVIHSRPFHRDPVAKKLNFDDLVFLLMINFS